MSVTQSGINLSAPAVICQCITHIGRRTSFSFVTLATSSDSIGLNEQLPQACSRTCLAYMNVIHEDELVSSSLTRGRFVQSLSFHIAHPSIIPLSLKRYFHLWHYQALLHNQAFFFLFWSLLIMTKIRRKRLSRNRA